MGSVIMDSIIRPVRNVKIRGQDNIWANLVYKISFSTNFQWLSSNKYIYVSLNKESQFFNLYYCANKKSAFYTDNILFTKGNTVYGKVQVADSYMDLLLDKDNSVMAVRNWREDNQFTENTHPSCRKNNLYFLSKYSDDNGSVRYALFLYSDYVKGYVRYCYSADHQVFFLASFMMKMINISAQYLIIIILRIRNILCCLRVSLRKKWIFLVW